VITGTCRLAAGNPPRMVARDHQARGRCRQLRTKHLIIGARPDAGTAQQLRGDRVPAPAGLPQQIDLPVQDLADRDGGSVQRRHKRSASHLLMVMPAASPVRERVSDDGCMMMGAWSGPSPVR
jgi:hypothetical protein